MATTHDSSTNPAAAGDGDDDDASREDATEDAPVTQLQNQSCMLSVVAHDLRHPLFRIALSAELIKEAGNLTSQDVYIQTILDMIAGMSRLIDDLDDYGSLRTGRLRVLPQAFAPLALIDAALGTFQVLARARSIELCSCVGELPRILGDRDRLQQVLSNLIGNAMGLTPLNGRIVLGGEVDGDMVRFSVSDTGPGIHPDDVPHLFDRYWRGAQTVYNGHGLGLAIARGLVEQHGGKIWAENASTGGARFSFTIPVAR